jgi:selenocysteine lyase/cysteine desulfurase
LGRRDALRCAFDAIEEYERTLCWRIIDGLRAIDGIRIWGITDSGRNAERAPTVSFTHDSMSPRQIADELADRGIFVWAGNFYALELTEALDLEPDGVLRVGVLHYNTMDEVESFLHELEDILSC